MDQSDASLTRRQVLGMGAATAALIVTGCSTGQPVVTRATIADHPRGRPTTPSAGRSSGTPAASPGGPAVQVARATSGRAQVALTFHGAGELTIARQIHDVLGASGAKATIMAVGTWLAASPHAIKMFHDSGHDIGNHTWSHGIMADMSASATLKEIERCRDELVDVIGTPGAFFRQSSAQTATEQELVEAGLAGYQRVLSYDIDGLDWKDPGPAAIRSAVAAATAGSIVSLHLGHQGTVIALPGILADLAARGLSPVTATELLR